MNNSKGHHTFNEILSQPTAWMGAIEAVQQAYSRLKKLRSEAYGQIIFIGCGSTHYLSLAAAPVAQELTGVFSRAFPASELLLYPQSKYPKKNGKTLLVAVSRSGTTTETLHAIRSFREARKGTVAVITNYPEAPLAGMGDINIVIPEGQETSIAQTRSFASMYVASVAMSAVLGDRDDLLASLDGLIPVGERLLCDYIEFARQWGENKDLKQFFFLGSGPRHGLACETSLKLKEMSLSVSEPFYFLEFRHGPMSMVTKETLLIGLLSDSARPQEEAVIQEMQKLGANTMVLAEDNADVSLSSKLPEIIRGVLYLPVLQLFGYYRAISSGLDPDKPNNLSAVVQLDW
ncbi:MAG: SIS domain-containing protein [Anaerolineae bacterium]|jgi:glucosamine--fructose-6-phosphate aminotransferase (isomerizing)